MSYSDSFHLASPVVDTRVNRRTGITLSRAAATLGG
jgi:hypothetical protein